MKINLERKVEVFLEDVEDLFRQQFRDELNGEDSVLYVCHVIWRDGNIVYEQRAGYGTELFKQAAFAAGKLYNILANNTFRIKDLEAEVVE